jgi:hypothetical protein
MMMDLKSSAHRVREPEDLRGPEMARYYSCRFMVRFLEGLDIPIDLKRTMARPYYSEMDSMLTRRLNLFERIGLAVNRAFKI